MVVWTLCTTIIVTNRGSAKFETQQVVAFHLEITHEETVNVTDISGSVSPEPVETGEL